MNLSAPSRGEIWDLSFDPTIGHEQAGVRPALIISIDLFNEGPADLILAIPITRTTRKVRWHVQVDPPDGGLVSQSFVLCDSVRSVSKARLKRRRGKVSEEVLVQVEDRLRILMGL